MDEIDRIYLKQAIEKGDKYLQESIEKGLVCRNCADNDTCVDICKALYNTCLFFEPKK
jgi:hypothetical protein